MDDINLDKIKVNYDKKDFLYYKYAYDGETELYSCTGDSGSIKSGTFLERTCDEYPELKDGNGPCSNDFTNKLCINKNRADEMLAQTANHSGADELYKNTTSKYHLERLNFFNLGIGVISTIVFIYINK
jgi:hypothetical protein